MLTALEVQNLRSFEAVRWPFQLPQLTVICGTNSAGKSTLLKVPLLLRQSQASASPATRTSGRLSFVGAHANLGSYESLVTDNDASQALGLGIKAPFTVDSDTIDWLETLRSDDRPTNRRQSRSPVDMRAQISAFFEFEHLDRELVDPGNQTDHRLARAEFVVHANDHELLRWVVRSGQEPDGSYEMDLPGEFFRSELKTYGTALRITGIGVEEVRTADEIPVGVVLDGLMPSAIRASVTAPGLTGRVTHLPLPLEISKPLEAVRDALDSVHYLGPLRSPAQRFYVTQEDAPPVFDPSGDFVPYVLRDNGSDGVAVLLPGSSEISEIALTKAVGEWLHFLRTGEPAPPGHEELRIRTTRRVLVELELTPPSGGNPHAMADSGFGYSQVLPILVRGILARQGETLMIEQPELHLHPALQVRLAAFLVALANSGRQVVVETHSEHIVNAIRVNVAESDSSFQQTQSQIVYVDGRVRPPHVHELGVDSDGTVPDWPAEFFGEALELSGRLLRAQRKQGG